MVITIVAEQLYSVLNSSVDNQGNKQPYSGYLQVSIGAQGIRFSANKVMKSTVNLPKVREN